MAISRVLQQLRWFVDGQPLGWCLLAALVAVCGASCCVLFRVARRGSTLGAVVWTAGTATLSATLAALQIARAREEVLALLLRPSSVDASKGAWRLAVSFSHLAWTQHFTSAVLSAAMLAVLVAALWGRPSLPKRRLIALTATLFLSTAVMALDASQGLRQWSCVGADNPRACMFEQASQSVAHFEWAVRCVVASAALAWTLGLWWAFRAARAGVTSDRGVLIASTALLSIGVVAFSATRAEHADRRHLVPADPPQIAWLGMNEQLHDQLPMAKPGCSLMAAPLVEVRADSVLVDGTELATVEALRTVLAQKRELWEQLNPGLEFPSRVLLAASRTARASDVQPWLLAAARAGYTNAGAVLQVPTVKLETRTVGVLEIRRNCSEVWRLDAALDRAFTHFQTWGELVAAGGVAAPEPDPRRSETSRCGSLTAPALPEAASLFGKARQLRKRGDLDALMNQAKRGAPERIALRVEGTGSVMCECPPLEIPISDPDSSNPSLLAVPKSGVASVGLDRTLLDFIVVGYFSGAWIDSFEYLRTQREDHPLTDDETRTTYRELATEFCLEASCYSVPEIEPASASSADPELRQAEQAEVKEQRARRAEEIAEMATLGIPKCRREWLSRAR